jgi:hypothetical protein
MLPSSRRLASLIVAPLDVGNGLVGVVSLAVGENVVDDHSDNGEEEDNKSPEDLVGDRAVRLEDLDCVARQLQPHNKEHTSSSILVTGTRDKDLLQAMISSTKTMNPTIPPPVPACHGFALIAETGAASASMKKESWRRAAMTKLNILADVYLKTARIVSMERGDECCGVDGCCLGFDK